METKVVCSPFFNLKQTHHRLYVYVHTHTNVANSQSSDHNLGIYFTRLRIPSNYRDRVGNVLGSIFNSHSSPT